MLVPGWGHGSTKAWNILSSLFLPSQQSLLRQQERVEERVQEIEEQLCKLDSDKCVVEVCLAACSVGGHRITHILHIPHSFMQYSEKFSWMFELMCVSMLTLNKHKFAYFI